MGVYLTEITSLWQTEVFFKYLKQKVPEKYKHRVQWFFNISTATETADLLSIVNAYVFIKIGSDGINKYRYAIGDAIDN